MITRRGQQREVTHELSLSLCLSSQPVKAIEGLDLIERSDKKAKKGEDGKYAKDCGEGGNPHPSEPKENLRHKVSYRDSLFRGVLTMSRWMTWVNWRITLLRMSRNLRMTKKRRIVPLLD